MGGPIAVVKAGAQMAEYSPTALIGTCSYSQVYTFIFLLYFLLSCFNFFLSVIFSLLLTLILCLNFSVPPNSIFLLFPPPFFFLLLVFFPSIFQYCSMYLSHHYFFTLASFNCYLLASLIQLPPISILLFLVTLLFPSLSNTLYPSLSFFYSEN